MATNSTIKKTIIAIIIFCVLIACVLLFFFLSKNSSTFVIKNNAAQDFGGNNSIEGDGIKEANQQAVEKAKQKAIQPVRSINSEDHFLGDLEAPVQIIIYSDFTCPFCAEFYDTFTQIQIEFGDKAVLALRHYSLNRHVYAMQAAMASECAAEQGKFWEMHNKLFENNKENKLNMEQFKENAAVIGLNELKFNKCMETEKYKDKIYKQISESKNYGVAGSPTIFVNNEPLPGAYPFENFIRTNGQEEKGMKSIIERHLRNK